MYIGALKKEFNLSWIRFAIFLPLFPMAVTSLFVMYILAAGGFYLNYDKFESSMNPWIFEIVQLIMQVGPIPYVVFLMLSVFWFRPYNFLKRKNQENLKS